MSRLLWLIPILPLAGFLVNALLRPRRSVAAGVGCAGPIASLALSVAAFLECRAQGLLREELFTWIAVSGEKLSIPFGLAVDPLGAVMILVVTGVGSLIHIYSIAYMHDDEGIARFFAYLNLFMFSMLLLVLGDSIVLMFVGWEGVGLCSYLLIGFWYKERKNADAGMKAFVTNRIGDFGFLLGMFLLWKIYGTLSFGEMQAREIPTEMLPLALPAALLLFLGACGKSAQIPLYVWLPDAMAGPTPVSALIHAATMVTAGVYMVGRMHFLYAAAPGSLEVMGMVAAATALLTAVIAVAQNDIKKVLAYSTISQLGFMFGGMATAEFTTGIFHVVTHAFFKALLFLGAGAVIHALHGEQDIRKMGGLGKKLPALAICFVAGGLALSGFPFSAGFVSKDAILTAAYLHASPIVFGMLALAALLTAFYTTRLCVVVFLGPAGHAPAGEHSPEEHSARELHPPGPLMMAPLVILAVLSAFGGILLEERLGEWLGQVWGDKKAVDAGLLRLKTGDVAAAMDASLALARHGLPVVEEARAAGVPKDRLDLLSAEVNRAHRAHLGMMAGSSALFLLGAGAAFLIYTRARAWLGRMVEGPWKGLYRLVSHKFYVDEIYEVLVIAPIQMGATAVWFVIDRVLIDTVLVGGVGQLVYVVGGALRRPHTGSINAAVASFVVGAIVILGYLIYRFGPWTFTF
jgi:NADH-quinone oxidoreductase subunit L